ncbi:MAG: hypothetical protein ACTMKY_13235, partial [Dermabacteraceae bacterium]
MTAQPPRSAAPAAPAGTPDPTGPAVGPTGSAVDPTGRAAASSDAGFEIVARAGEKARAGVISTP